MSPRDHADTSRDDADTFGQPERGQSASREGRSGTWWDLVRPYEPCPLPDPNHADPDHTGLNRGGLNRGGVTGGLDPDQAEPGRPASEGEDTTSAHHTEQVPGARRGLVLTPPGDPGRRRLRALGWANKGPLRRMGLAPADCRYHTHMIGRTGAGKSTELASIVLSEAQAGRGFVLIDCQGDLSTNVLDRLPRECADRLVILDPEEPHALPAFNPLAPDWDDPSGRAGEWAAEHVAGTFKALYSASWGARMEDYLRGACLTLARRPGSTIPDILGLLTDPAFRARVLDEHGTPDGLGTLWQDLDAMTPAARANLCAPLITRLRGVLSRRFARELLTPARSTFNMSDILDGGILIAGLKKGEIGAETSRLLTGLLLATAWAHTTRRSRRPPEQRPDASIILDEAANVLGLPIELDLALAESRGYRVGWVLAHQHCDQLPPKIAAAIDANCRNKLVFTVSPADARKLAHHFRPHLSEHTLSAQPAYEICARTVKGGQDLRPYTLNAEPLPDPIPGRADWLRARARARTGLTHAARRTARTQAEQHSQREPDQHGDSRRGAHHKANARRRSRLERDTPDTPNTSAPSASSPDNQEGNNTP